MKVYHPRQAVKLSEQFMTRRELAPLTDVPAFSRVFYAPTMTRTSGVGRISER